MIEQEQQCFIERCHLRPEQFRVINVVQGERPTSSDLREIDALLIGGAGAFSAVEDYEWTPGLLDFVRHAVERDLPTFGSCWGHQVIARALGGRVVYDPDHSELGCGWVELTEAGQTDPLFHRFSRRFRANMGHHDRVVELPKGATELARNELPHQAFRLEDHPVYATQFHSELDAKRERERILVYRDHYQEALPDEETVQRVLAELADTTEVDHLLYDFLTTFVARRQNPSAPTRLPSRAVSLPSDPLGGGPEPSDRRIPDA
jgi:GMP synthase (glutamine-hydrolysing)